MKKLTLFLSGLLISLMLFSSCEKQRQNVIFIGADLDLTGPPAIYGKWILDGMKLAIDELNSANFGGKTWKLKVEDSMSDVKAGVNAFRKLIDTYNLKVIFVGPNSSTVMACAPIANQKKVILFAPASSSPSITYAGEYIFRNRISGDEEMKQLAKKVMEVGFRKVGFVAINAEMGVKYYEKFNKEFSTIGGNVISYVMVNLGETDFRTQITKLKDLKVKAVVLATPVKEAAFFIKQSAELGFNPQWFSTTPIESNELIKIAGDAAEGLMYVSETVDPDDPVYKSFASAFEKKYGYMPNIYSANAYDGIKIIAKIISEVGYNAVKIKNALYKVRGYHGAGGVVSFDSNGDVQKPMKLKIVKNGKFLLLKNTR